MAGRAPAHLALAIAVAVGLTFGVQGISSALPAIQHELGIRDSDLGLLTAAYMLPAVVLAIPLGYAADAFGRRRVFVSMAVLYGAAGLAQAWADDLGTLLILRVLQGVGFGALMPLSVTLIGDVYRGAAQLRAQANRQLAMQVGEFLLPLAGAGLAALAWNAPLAAQGILLPLALVGLVLLDDRRSDATKGAYARELMDAVRQPGMPAVMTAGALRFVCKFALLAYLPAMLVHDRGASLAQAALVVSAAAGAAAVVSPTVGRLLRRVRASRLLLVSVALSGAGLVGFAVAPDWRIALAVAVVFGVGDGLLSVLQNSLVTEAAPAAVRAGVVSVSGMTRNAGKLAGPLLMAAAILVVSVPASFAALGVLTWACLPALRGARRLDGLLGSPPGTTQHSSRIRYPEVGDEAGVP
jgi:ACDE family multidrug resistance protein